MSSGLSKVRLPVPSMTTGSTNILAIVPDGIIDWTMVLHLWVHPMDSDNGPIYAPCAVFLDQTWVMLGPLGSLEDARRTCQALSAAHDSGVSDPTRPKPEPRISHQDCLVDLEPSELPIEVSGTAWDYDAATHRCRLNLVSLGIDIANTLMDGEDLQTKLDACDVRIAGYANAFKASGVVPPHKIGTWVTKIREAGHFWLRETHELAGDGVETAEDHGRYTADDIRRENVTYADALFRLQEQVTEHYNGMRWVETGELIPERHEMAVRAFNAGRERLLYFARRARLRQEAAH